jgi:methyl-accepting chemotaxis protein
VADIVSQINDIRTTVAGAVDEQVATANEISRSLNEAAPGTSGVSDAISAEAASAEGVERNEATAEDVSVFLGDVAVELRHLVGSSR